MPKKITKNDYLQRCKEKGLDLPIEDYIDSKTKIKHKCKQGHIYLQSPSKHLRGQGCTKCNGKYHRTHEDYYNECKEKGYDLPIEKYVNNYTKIKHKCHKGHIYEQTPAKHLKGQSCPICNGNQKKTTEQYYNECKDKGLDLPIEDYKGSLIKIKHMCNKGHIYEQAPNSHLHGAGCPKCGTKKQAKKITKTNDAYLQECKDKGLDLPIEDYVNGCTKIKHKCLKGHIYKQTPSHHLHGNGCPICANIKKSNAFLKTLKKYIQECKEKGFDLPIEDYNGNKEKIKHTCSKGHVYYQTPSDHLQGIGCPICNESHGEKFIRNYLDKHNIKYESQKRFHGLKDKTYLSYDFYLSEYNTLIEYQGKQHYEECTYFGGKEKFQKQQYHDNLKREYAKNNGYKLLELHYSLDTQDKVDKYLKRRIKD